MSFTLTCIKVPRAFFFFSFRTRHIDARFSREKQKRKLVRKILDVKNHKGRKLGQILNYIINIH